MIKSILWIYAAAVVSSNIFAVLVPRDRVKKANLGGEDGDPFDVFG